MGTLSISIGVGQVAITRAAISALNLAGNGQSYFPDSGIFGIPADVVDGMNWYGTEGTINSNQNGSNQQLVKLTGGTLANPLVTATRSQVQQRTINYDYQGLCVVHHDIANGLYLALGHGEIWPGNSGSGTTGSGAFYSQLNLYASSDGSTWYDCGVILKPNVPFSYYAANGNTWPNGLPCIEIAGGSILIAPDGYMYVYFRDTTTAGAVVSIAAARCLYSSVVTAAKATLGGTSTAPTFNKYYNGAWASSGLNGNVTELYPGLNTGPWYEHNVSSNSLNWRATAYSPSLGLILMVAVDDALSNIYLITSADGISWSALQLISDHVTDGGSASASVFYPSLVPVQNTLKDNTVGTQFWLYLLVAPQGQASVWNADATGGYVARKCITITKPATNRWQRIIEEGPQRFYPFNESTGAICYDYGSDGVNLTLATNIGSGGYASVAGIVPGDADTALSLSSTNNIGNTPLASVVTNYQNTTWSIWLKLSILSQTGAVICSNAWGTDGFALICNGGNSTANGTQSGSNLFLVYPNGTSNYNGQSGSYTLPDTNAHLVHVTFDSGGHGRIYVDGVAVGNLTTTSPIATTTETGTQNYLVIGAGLVNGTMAATFKDFKMIPRLLSPSEISGDYWSQVVPTATGGGSAIFINS